jgi:hypothetical protein
MENLSFDSAYLSLIPISHQAGISCVQQAFRKERQLLLSASSIHELNSRLANLQELLSRHTIFVDI